MKRRSYYNGTEWTDVQSSEAAFLFVTEDNKLTVTPPAVPAEYIDQAVLNEEISRAAAGFAVWTEERRALTKKNDGSGVKMRTEEDGTFVAVAPAGCQMTKACQERAFKAFASWLDLQRERLSVEVDDDDEDEDDAAAIPVDDPDIVDDPEEDEEDTNDAPAPAPAPAPTPTSSAAPAAATIIRLDPDPGNWTPDDIDALFDGRAEF